MPITFVPPTGNPDSKIALVAEQPGKQEVRRREPFVGPAGDNLNTCLHAAGISRSECYITNVIKDLDKPLVQYVSIRYNSHNRTYSYNVSDDGQKYLNILREELSNCSANVLVALGNVALYALCNRAGITAWRGSVIESTLLPGRKVIPTLHPATFTQEKLYKNPDAYLNKHLISMDLRKVRKECEFPEVRRSDLRLLTQPTYLQCLGFLEQCEKEATQGCTIDYDIELHNGELGCISFAISPHEVMCIPFVGPKGDYFTPSQEREIMLRIESLMSNSRYRKRGQNVIFDSHFLLKKYGIRTHNLDDTMIAQKTLYPEFRIGLDFITSMWTDIPYYKADGKIWLSGHGEWEKGWQYNCLDSLACANSFPKQLAELTERGNIAAYRRQSALIEPLTYMMEHGIKVDMEGMAQDHRRHEELIREKEEELNVVAGRQLNANSPKQLTEYFYVHKNLTPYTKDGSLTVDADALKRIARKGHKEASLVLEIRRLIKRRSTYLNPNKIDDDGRIRCSYNPVGTVFSRISSSENIFGRGGNLQNWPHDLLKYLVADDNYVIYNIDMSQCENRVVAYVGNIPQMIQVFEAGLDSHKMTASLMFRKPYDEVLTEPGSSPIGDGSHSERDWGKRSNHAFNYGCGYKYFSLLNEIPEKEGKWIYEAFHRSYPGLKKGYWKYVEDQLRDDRTLTNLFGRKVTFYGRWGQDLLRKAYSCISQGTCGDLINERGLNHIYYNQQTFGPVELLTQIHDSIGFQIPLSVPLEKHAEILIAIKESLEQPLEFKGRRFVLPADLTVGFTLSKETGIEFKGETFSTHPTVLAERLKVTIGRLTKKEEVT